MNQKEESQRKLLLFLLVVIIVGLSGWLIYSLYGYTRTSSSTKTNKIIENDKKEQKKKKEEKKTEEKDELQELTDKMMIPFTEYNGYVITADSNNYFFTNDSYTFDTISDEQKVAIAIIIYRETIDDENDIPSYQVRKIIKKYFGKELSTNLPEKITLQHTRETLTLDNDKYISNEDYDVLSELSDRLQQRIVNKELINDELIVSVNFVFISYKPGSTYEKQEEIRSNIYTDFNKTNTLMIDVAYDQEETIVNGLLDGDKTYTYKYYFKKGTDNNYTFEKIVLEK